MFEQVSSDMTLVSEEGDLVTARWEWTFWSRMWPLLGELIVRELFTRSFLGP